MQSRVANLPDRVVRYFEAGAGRPLILLHAFPLSADQWLPQLHRVPPGWRFIAPDFRGFRGAGPAVEAHGVEKATMDGHASDVVALMRHLDVDRAVIAGLSMGGYVALALVRREPSRVAGLVLANTRAGSDSADGLAARDRMIDLASRDGAHGIARAMLPTLLGETTRLEQPDLIDAVRRLIEVNSTEAIISAIRAMKMRVDSSPLLPAIACPALIVTGAEDALIHHGDGEAMRLAIAGAQLLVVPRAGHLSNLEAPRAFNDGLAAFLSNI